MRKRVTNRDDVKTPKPGITWAQIDIVLLYAGLGDDPLHLDAQLVSSHRDIRLPRALYYLQEHYIIVLFLDTYICKNTKQLQNSRWGGNML